MVTPVPTELAFSGIVPVPSMGLSLGFMVQAVAWVGVPFLLYLGFLAAEAFVRDVIAGSFSDLHGEYLAAAKGSREARARVAGASGAAFGYGTMHPLEGGLVDDSTDLDMEDVHMVE